MHNELHIRYSAHPVITTIMISQDLIYSKKYSKIKKKKTVIIIIKIDLDSMTKGKESQSNVSSFTFP